MPDTDGVRLQKFISTAGICSRRAAETFIENGQVSVNGKTAELGQRIVPGRDRVVVQGQLVQPQTALPMTLAMHKPKGYICSHTDPHHKRTIYDLLPPQLAERRFLCAGRLDLESEGLLILTTDGDLANRLMHPKSRVVKRYTVTLNRPFPLAKVPILLRGVMFEGEELKAEKAFPIKTGRGDEFTDWEVHLHHGKKREIRRLFETLGYRVKRLKRFQIGSFSLRRIPLAKSKIMNDHDLRLLFKVDERTEQESFF
jgi:23S rRNA pseudouridine2605 synthase